jgi:hypothetical protein
MTLVRIAIAASAFLMTLELRDAMAGQALQQRCNAYLTQNQGTLLPLSTTCSGTELALFARDVTGGCLSCAMTQGDIDSQLQSGSECENLGTGPAPACLATLDCYLGVQNENNPPGLLTPGPAAPPGNVKDAYCAPPPALFCNGTGICASVITAGFPAGYTPSQIEANLAAPRDPTKPSGQAGYVVSSLLSSNCNSCFPSTLPAPALPPWALGLLACCLAAVVVQATRSNARLHRRSSS